jgi:ElaB/YqjD/DUF883 family membrane-anchored ribosome-binding protein
MATNDQNNIADLDTSENLQEQVQAYYEQLKETQPFQAVQQAKENLVEYIEENPVQSSLIALGVGIAIGLLFSRGKD